MAEAGVRDPMQAETRLSRGTATPSQYKCQMDGILLYLYDHAFVCPRCGKAYWRETDPETGEILPAFVRKWRTA